MAGEHVFVNYDSEYVKGGCQGSLPAGVILNDNMISTYTTNYIIALVGIVSAVLMWCNPRQDRSYNTLSSIWFLGTAVGFGLPGVLHQVADEGFDLHAWEVGWKASYSIGLLGVLALHLLTNRVLCARLLGRPKWQPFLAAVAVLLTAGIIGVMVVGEPSLLTAGAYYFAVLIYVLIVFWFARDCLGAVGAVLVLCSYITWVLLQGLCGDPAFADCFRDCPLPAQFNHNAVFHVLYALGLAFLGVAMYKAAHKVQEPESCGNGRERASGQCTDA